ncbi:MAG TPA: hypothetical protein VFO85_22480, partial [Vicinamibacteria bacterium]|nr:hypothetical protein [Vicinamibacteria bacterium]
RVCTRSGTSSRDRTRNAEDELTLVPVVGPAAQLDVSCGRFTPDGIRLAMVELDEGGLVASALSALEGATPVVARPYLSPHGGRNVSAVGTLAL